MKLPGQYPQLWEKSVFRKWPKSLWNVVCIFSMFCSVYLVCCYVADFGLMDLLYLVVCGCHVCLGYLPHEDRKGWCEEDRERKK